LEKDIQSSEPRSALASAKLGPVGEKPRVAPDIAALTRRMTEGDEMAWRTFYDAYFDRLWRYLLVVAAGNEDAAREALQGALVRAARHVKVFRDEEVFWSWLTVLARSAFSDEARKRRRYFSFLDRFTRQASVANDGANDLRTDEQLGVLLERHVARLPPDERELIEQKYFARRAVRDLAGERQTTEKAVESKLARVRKKLKDAVLAELKNENA
jgi:RNA polymerase sigma-70 factor, ECF subfamily